MKKQIMLDTSTQPGWHKPSTTTSMVLGNYCPKCFKPRNACTCFQSDSMINIDAFIEIATSPRYTLSPETIKMIEKDTGKSIEEIKNTRLYEWL